MVKSAYALVPLGFEQHRDLGEVGRRGDRDNIAGHDVRRRAAMALDVVACKPWSNAIVSSHHERRRRVGRSVPVSQNAIPSAFVSVSLSAAGADPSYPGLRDCVERLERDTLWRPGVVHHAVGAMPFSASGFFTKFAIMLIARRHGMLVKTSQGYDLTYYAALEAFIDRFVASAIGTDCPPIPIWSASRWRR